MTTPRWLVHCLGGYWEPVLSNGSGRVPRSADRCGTLRTCSQQMWRLLLPDFERPPVIEVAVGVEFVAMPALGAVTLVALARRWSAEYPDVYEQPPLPPGRSPGTVLAPFAFQFSTWAPAIRLWMLRPDGQTLVQVQNDRLVLNWRRTNEGDQYPRYRVLLPEFLRLWDDFLAFVQERTDQLPHTAVAEVTFVNSIRSPTAHDLSTVMATVATNEMPGTLVETRISHVLDVGEPEAPARTWIEAAPGARADEIVLTVSTRGALRGDAGDAEAITATLDHAHACGVNGFSQVTRQSMHEEWGRTE
jgi:uncharacterized protein (TIGR04255 family)